MQNKPISKQDAMNRSSVEVANAVNEIVGVINKKLQNYVAGSYVSVDMSRTEESLPRDVWNKAKEKVIVLYKSQGWSISFNNGSQRDSLCQFDLS